MFPEGVTVNLEAFPVRQCYLNHFDLQAGGYAE